MINANELRIGNWVLVAGTGEVHPAQININNLRQILIDGGVVLPIPLTPEILENAGFSNYKNGNVDMNLKTNLINFNYDHEEKFLCFWDLETEESIAVPMYHINHLHQLQNLYFALTGEELICTP